MLSRDVMSVVVSQASVAELGLWRQTSKSLRDLVTVEEWNRAVSMQPAEKVEFLCRIAILIAENPEFYRKDELFKTQLRRMAQGAFPNELIAALTLACLSRITSTSIQTLNDGDLPSLSPIMIRAIKVVAGEKSNPCTLTEITTLETPYLASFCARILGLQDYDIKNLIQRLPEGVAFHPLIKNHPNLLLPILLSRIDEVEVFEEICSCIFSADEQMVDPPAMRLLYIRALQREAQSCLSSSQSVVALQIMLEKLKKSEGMIHFLSLVCQRINSKNSAHAMEILLTFVQDSVVDAGLLARVLDIIFIQFLAGADTPYVHKILTILMPLLKHPRGEVRDAVLRGLHSLKHHLTAKHTAVLIEDSFPLTIYYEHSSLLRIPLLASLIQYMDDVTVQVFLSQSLECLSNTLNESDLNVIVPILSLLEHPAINKEMALAEIVRIMLEKVSSTMYDTYAYTCRFLDYVVPLYDPDSEKFVLPFLRALYHAYAWTSELTEESISANLENAAKYIVLHNELKHGVFSYTSYIKKLVPKLSDIQAQRLWSELESIGKMDKHPVDITFAQVLIEKLTVEQQQAAKSVILNNLYPDVLEDSCQAMVYLAKTELCSIDEIVSVLKGVYAVEIEHRNYLRANGYSPGYDSTKYICQVLTELGVIDYLRKLFADPDVMVRAVALPGIVRLLPHCSEWDVKDILEDLNSELRGQRGQTTPKIQLETANALHELAKVYPMKFKERLFRVLLIGIEEAQPRICASLYQALATSLSVLEAHEQKPYIQEILPLLTRDTQNLLKVIAMVKSLPNLIAKLEAGSLHRLLDTLTSADPQAANEVAKVFEILIKVLTEADEKSALQTIANHPRARILCGLLLPLALLPEPASPDNPANHC